MIPDYPTTRTEAYLAAILGGDGALPVPESRTDLYLAKIAGMDTQIPDDPQTRSEKYLAAILGADLVLPAPLSRKDFYLAKKAGMDVDLPAEPQTRLEAYLAEWAGEPSGQWKTVTGSLIHITDALASPVNALSVNIDPVQSGSGDPSPDNVRPISGHSAVNVWRTGKNLFDMTVYDGGVYNPSVGRTLTLTKAGAEKQFTPGADGTWTVGTTTANATYTFIIPVKDGEKYRIYFKSSGTTTARRSYGYLDKSFKVLKRTNSTDSSHTINTVIEPETATVGCAYYFITLTNGTTASETLTVESPQMELGTAGTAYEPYSGTSVTISLNGTRYGGTLDVLSGVLTVNMAYLTFDGTDNRGFAAGDTGTAGYKLLAIQLNAYDRPKGKVFATSATVPKLVCNKYKTVSSDAVFSRTQGATAIRTGLALRFYDESLQTVDAWTTAMSQTQLQVAYEIDAPFTVQLTPSEVTTILGENNIWADTGDTTVTYLANA